MTERDEYLTEKMGFKKVKPTHGTCCSCQKCGHYHEDCICKEFSECAYDWYELLEWVEDQGLLRPVLEYTRKFGEADIATLTKLILPMNRLPNAVYKYLKGKEDGSKTYNVSGV